MRKMAVQTALGFSVLMAGISACAELITTNPELPPLPPELPPEGGYLTPDEVHALFTGPGLAIILERPLHRPIALESRTPVGPDEHEIFNSSLNGNVSVNASPFLPASASGLVHTVVQGKVGNITGTFQTEMLSMDLSGTSPFGPFLIRESPTLPSLGLTSITDIGGGLYRIDSFFDVFTELSIDGGQTWMPDANGPAHVELSNLPEPSTYGAGLLLLGAVGAAWYRRRSAN